MFAVKNYALGLITAVSMCSSTSMAAYFPPAVGGQTPPPYENLIQAKQLVQSVANRVQSIIQKSGGYNGGGEGGGTDGRGGEYGGSQQPRGEWPAPSLPGRMPYPMPGFVSADDDVAGEVLENDQLANLALQIMGRELFELGQVVDMATMNYNSPAFWAYWQDACQKSCKLLIGNQGAKVSAAIPMQGLVTAADFEPNDYELNAVKQQLWCQ